MTSNPNFDLPPAYSDINNNAPGYQSGSAPYPPASAPYPPASVPFPSASAPYPPASAAGSAPYPPYNAYPSAYPPAYPPANPGAPPPPNGASTAPTGQNVLPPVIEIEGELRYEDVQHLLGGFNDKSIRLGFIRKVYGILTAQLAVTFAIMCIFIFSDKVKNYVLGDGNSWVLWTAFGLTLACMIVLICCSNIRKQFPHNLIFLGIFTCCEGVLLGIVATTYEPRAVLVAAGITCVVVLGITLFAFQTKFDFTTCGAGLFVVLLVFICFGFTMIFFHSYVLRMIYASIGALIFCFYLLFDTQLMIGGKHKYSISPEEYIMAALNLYLDVINLFLYILILVGGKK